MRPIRGVTISSNSRIVVVATTANSQRVVPHTVSHRKNRYRVWRYSSSTIHHVSPVRSPIPATTHEPEQNPVDFDCFGCYYCFSDDYYCYLEQNNTVLVLPVIIPWSSWIIGTSSMMRLLWQLLLLQLLLLIFWILFLLLWMLL